MRCLPAMVLALVCVVATPPVAAAETEVLRPFAPQDFALAFDVLLGSGDLERAFLVARQAVAALPQDRDWRRKLARVSDWTQRPLVAAEHWLALFAQGDRGPDTLAAVLRLAPLAGQPMVALQAWAVLARQKPLGEAQWRDIYNLYDSAAEPAQGSLFFEAQFGSHKNPLLLEMAARLAENAGDDERALQLYTQRADLLPFSLDVVLHAVVSLLRRDRLPAALALMRTHEAQVAPDAVEFWRLLGQVAWELQAFAQAQDAYARYTRLPQAVAADWSRLIYLVRQQHPAQAADLALQAWRRFGAPEQLLQALGLYAELGDSAAQARVFDALLPQELALVGKETRFLLLRAQFYQRQNKPQLAWQDLRAALVLSPQDPDVILSSLWFLIDGKRTDGLPQLLQLHAAQAASSPLFWPAYAAANQVLERHREALFWYEKLVRRQTDDPLLLLNYADSLERTNAIGMADRMRRHAWLQLRDKYPQPGWPLKLGQHAELLALARLSVMNQPGDPALAVVRQLVNQLRGVSDDQPDEQTQELVLGWAILREQFDNARSWMWQRYARQSRLQAPLWGQSQVALQLKDSNSMESLLARHGDALPVYNRYDTAYELGQVQRALDIAFNGMAKQEDEPLYDRFRQHAPLQANYVQVGLQASRQGLLDSNGLQFETRLALNSRLQLVLGGVRQQLSVSEPVLASLASTSDRLASLEARWLGAGGPLSLKVFQHSGLASVTGFQVAHSAQWGGRLSLDSGLDFQGESTLTQPMRLAGYENSVFASLNYTLGKREYVRLAPRWSRYYTQWGDALGSGLQFDAEVGYRIRTEYPDWRVRGFATHQQFSRESALSAQALAQLPAELQTAINNGSVEPVSYFIPDSSSSWGACLGMGDNLAGQNLQTTYSRAWRPFMDLCFNHNTSGVSGSLGIAGSVTGEDHLLLQLQSSDSALSGSEASTTLLLRYRRYF